MSYAGFDARWHEIVKTKIASSNSETLPLFLFAFSSDKGVEQITDFTANDFFTMYGKTADFFKYGQPLTQAHTVLRAGGRVLGYRICAEDATMANIIVSAGVTQIQKNKYDKDGKQLYISDTGEETTEVTNTPATVNVASIKYTAKTVASAKEFAKIVEEANKIGTDAEFPLLVVSDNGRGKSIKKFRITPDYSVSKTLNFCMYNLIDIENTTVMESTRFALNPDAKYLYGGNTRSTNLIENSTVQLKTTMLDTSIGKFVTKLAEISGYSAEELFKNDILFGATVKGIALEGIEIDETGLNIATNYGIELQSGSNGNFTDEPFAGETPTPEWTAQAVKFFGGELTDEIYDLDIYKIDFCTDANYPDEVKSKIVDLAKWRKDFYYLRDLGTKIWNFDNVINKVSVDEWKKSAYVGDYLTTYEIIDPNSKKQIRVTMTHGLSPILVKHYATNISAPLAGQFNDFVITEAIKGTINFSPRVTPKLNQKEMLDDLKVNFANYSNPGVLVVQSLYTSQDHYGPLSFSCNTIITQMLVKDIRSYMPKVRFQQTESPDFTALAQAVSDNVLSKYQRYFKDVKCVYMKDIEETSQKLFVFAVECYYKDFAQSELADIYAIDGSPDDDASSYNSNMTDVE